MSLVSLGHLGCEGCSGSLGFRLELAEAGRGLASLHGPDAGQKGFRV